MSTARTTQPEQVREVVRQRYAQIARAGSATIRAAGLCDIEVVSDRGFGAVALTMVPEPMLRQAATAGIDVQRVAETVRSLTIRARKPQRA
jgi:hypothetical protein